MFIILLLFFFFISPAYSSSFFTTSPQCKLDEPLGVGKPPLRKKTRENLENHVSAFPLKRVSPPLPKKKKGKIDMTSNMNHIFTSKDDLLFTKKREKSHPRDRFNKLYQTTRRLSRTSPQQCRNFLANYYRKESSWKELNREERLKKIFNLSYEVYDRIVRFSHAGLCAKSMASVYETTTNQQVRDFLLSKKEDFLTTFPQEIKRTHREVSLFTEKLLKYYSWKILGEFRIDGDQYIPTLHFHNIPLAKDLELPHPAKIAAQFLRRKTPKDKFKELYIQHLVNLMASQISEAILDKYIYKTTKKLMSIESEIPLEKIRTNKECSALSKALKEEGQSHHEGQLLAEVKKRYSQKKDPDILDSRLTPHMARCIIIQETRSSFDPHTLNYTFCNSRGFMKSTAQGLGQTTLTSFDDLRRRALLPLFNSYGYNPKSKQDNKELFESLNQNPEMQMEVIFRQFNYYLKVRNNLENAISSYDMDNRSKYVRFVTSCVKCLNKFDIKDSEAGKKCQF